MKTFNDILSENFIAKYSVAQAEKTLSATKVLNSIKEKSSSILQALSENERKDFEIDSYELYKAAKAVSDSKPYDRGMKIAVLELKKVWGDSKGKTITSSFLEPVKEKIAVLYPHSYSYKFFNNDIASICTHHPMDDSRFLDKVASLVSDQETYNDTVIKLGVTLDRDDCTKVRSYVVDRVNKRLGKVVVKDVFRKDSSTSTDIPAIDTLQIRKEDFKPSTINGKVYDKVSSSFVDKKDFVIRSFKDESVKDSWISSFKEKGWKIYKASTNNSYENVLLATNMQQQDLEDSLYDKFHESIKLKAFDDGDDNLIRDIIRDTIKFYKGFITKAHLNWDYNDLFDYVIRDVEEETGESITETHQAERITKLLDEILEEEDSIRTKESISKKSEDDEEPLLKPYVYEPKLRKPPDITVPVEIPTLEGKAKEAFTKILTRTGKIRELKDTMAELQAEVRAAEEEINPEVAGYMEMAENAFKKADLVLNSAYDLETKEGDILAAIQMKAKQVPATGETIYSKDAETILNLLKAAGKVTQDMVEEMEKQIDKLNEGVKYITEVTRKVVTWPPSKTDIEKIRRKESIDRSAGIMEWLESAWNSLKEFFGFMDEKSEEFVENVNEVMDLVDEVTEE